VDSPVHTVCSLPEASFFRRDVIALDSVFVGFVARQNHRLPEETFAVDSCVSRACSLPEASVLQRSCCCLRFSRVSRDSSLPEASFLALNAHC
jgi:hypothetical protein